MATDELQCKYCDLSLPSRNKLFKHLVGSHPGSAPLNDDNLVKIALLVGYKNTLRKGPETNNVVQSIGGRVLDWHDDESESLENMLWGVLNRLKLSADDTACFPSRPLGWSRVTAAETRRSPFLTQSPSTPTVSELVCFNAPLIEGELATSAWLDQLHGLLPSGIRVHGRCDVPPSTHAEVVDDASIHPFLFSGRPLLACKKNNALAIIVAFSCYACQLSQKDCELRRFECLVPLELLDPDLVAAILLSGDAIPTEDAPMPEDPLGNEPSNVDQSAGYARFRALFRRLKSVLQHFQVSHPAMPNANAETRAVRAAWVFLKGERRPPHVYRPFLVEPVRAIV
jgi:hypothetical protein